MAALMLGVFGFIVINIDPVLLQLGPIALRWYGLMYVVGIIVGIYVAMPYVKAKGITEDQVWTVLGPCIVAGLVGGRLFYVVQQPLGPFIQQPWRIFATWEGGMAFYGAIFAVIVVLWFVCWREHIPFWTLLDGAAIFAAVGQAFGRVGNIINGDIVGAPTTLPWGVIYANPNSFVLNHRIAYQPAAAYELLSNLILIALLLFLRFRLKIPGLLVAVYLLYYAASQFILFFLRNSEPVVLGSLKQALVVSIIVFVAALAFAAWRIREGGEEAKRDKGEMEETEVGEQEPSAREEAPSP